MTLQVSQVVSRLDPAGGGPSYSVPALALALKSAGVKVRVHSLRRDAFDSPAGLEGDVFIHDISRGILARRLGAAPSLKRALTADASEGFVLHTHGLWLLPNVYPAWVKRRSGQPTRLVHSPRGMLGREALKFSKCKKRVSWYLMQRSAIQAADCIHATAESEYDEIRAAGLKQPVAIIPNGIDMQEAATSSSLLKQNVVLSLGRIHPKKGLDRLVTAWAAIERDFPLWSLRIVGPAEQSHDAELKAIAQSLGTQRVSIEGAVFGEDKARLLQTSRLSVLSTLNENFGIAVAEALAAELPVISTKGAPWAGLVQHRCGWWIDHGVGPMIAALRHALALPVAELDAMGARGRAWMGTEFQWGRVGLEMLGVYRWLSGDSERPQTVRVS